MSPHKYWRPCYCYDVGFRHIYLICMQPGRGPSPGAFQGLGPEMGSCGWLRRCQSVTTSNDDTWIEIREMSGHLLRFCTGAWQTRAARSRAPLPFFFFSFFVFSQAMSQQQQDTAVDAEKVEFTMRPRSPSHFFFPILIAYITPFSLQFDLSLIAHSDCILTDQSKEFLNLWRQNNPVPRDKFTHISGNLFLSTSSAVWSSAVNVLWTCAACSTGSWNRPTWRSAVYEYTFFFSSLAYIDLRMTFFWSPNIVYLVWYLNVISEFLMACHLCRSVITCRMSIAHIPGWNSRLNQPITIRH